MIGTWSGTFGNDEFSGPGVYQAKNGVRVFIDMASTPGPVTVNAVVDPEDDASFIVEWDNPDRSLLTLATADLLESFSSVNRTLNSSLTTRIKRGVVGFTFFNDRWDVFSLARFGNALNNVAFVGWRGRSTNGLATLLAGSLGTVEVERTATGKYSVRLDAGVILSGGVTLVFPSPIATGLPANNMPVLRVDDVGIATADEILITSGVLNMGGVFLVNDLDAVATNLMAIKVQQFP